MLVGKAPHTSMRAHGLAPFGSSDVGDDLGTFLQARAYHFKFGKVEGGCPSTPILILKARPMIRTKLLVFTSLLTVSVFAHAQEILPLDKITGQAQLEKTITALDTALFDAYNRCDLQKFGSLIDENIEFYHDKAGNTFGRTALTEAIKNNICGKGTRELVPGTLQVFPMKGYGALEIGEKVRAAVQGLALPHATSNHQAVTVSVGVASTTPVDTLRPSDLVEAADASLYVAKRSGRNSVAGHGLALSAGTGEPAALAN